MVECDFCGEEFDTEMELHIHWSEEHGDELNSHQEDKVKKAERKKDEQKEKKLRKRKRMAGYGLGGGVAIVLFGFIGLQLVNSAGGSSGTLDPSQLDGQPFMGEEDAPVTVVEFGDYRCPFCRQFEMTVYPELKRNYIDSGEVKFYFINFAFLGPGSTQAAVAGECVYDQDKQAFWDFHHAVYENQGPESEQWVTTDLMVQIARDNTQGLDYEQLRSCIQNQDTASEVRSDRNYGQRSEVSATPSVYVNGEKVDNWRYGGLSSRIDKALQ